MTDRPLFAAPSLVSLVSLVALAACKDPPRPPGPAASASAPIASAAPKPPSPIDGALPTEAPRPLDRRAECNKEGFSLKHVVPDEVRPALSDGAPAVIWEQRIGERSSLVFPRDEGVEVMGVVLDGSVDLTAMEEAPKHTPVGGRFTAFRAPGGGVTIHGAGGAATRVALVVATTAPGKSLGAYLDERDRPGAPPVIPWKSRPKPISTMSFADRPDLAWGGGAYHARIGWESDDKPAAVIDIMKLSADAPVAEHVHDDAWEILAALEGDGTLVKRTAGGEQRVHVAAGSIHNVPKGQRHAWQPSGKAPLFAIQIYAPPGPEQRFKKLAK